jgi:hypothetical protein
LSGGSGGTRPRWSAAVRCFRPAAPFRSCPFARRIPMAHKLRLSLEHLRVESFVPEGAEEGENGTVRGFDTGRCNTGLRATRDEFACYTIDPEYATYQAVYTCPECPNG